MRLRLSAALPVLAASLFLSAPAMAATVGGYTSFFVFGDSLSDPGNLFAATGGTVPGAPYVNGRFSNGPVWAETVAARFAGQGLATANFAYARANVIGNGDAIPDLGLQLGLFALTVPQAAKGTEPLAAIWMGANDLFDGLDSVADGTLDAEGVIATGVAAAKGVAAAVAMLASGGVSDVVVLNLPDLGRIPAYAGTALAALASQATEAFNSTLAAELAQPALSGTTVIRIDVNGLFDALLADPAAFGVANATTPCYIPGVATCGAEAAKTLAFFDPVHPSAAIHAEIAGIVGAVIAPVPLPASGLLLAGSLAALAWARQRVTTA